MSTADKPKKKPGLSSLRHPFGYLFCSVRRLTFSAVPNPSGSKKSAGNLEFTAFPTLERLHVKRAAALSSAFERRNNEG